MALYRYRALDREGRELEGGCLADSEAAARQRLHGRGLTLLSLESRHGGPLRVPFSLDDARDLFDELETLLEAGLDLLQALRTIEEATRRGGKLKVVQTLREGLNAGLPLSQAMAQAWQAGEHELPPLHHQLLAVGEQSGTLGRALARIVEHLEFQRRVRDEVRGALVYPAALLAVSLLALGFILVVVVPQFAAMFPGDAIERLPPLSAALIGLGRFSGEWTGGLLAAFVATVVAIAWALRARAAALAGLADRLPLVGPALRRVDCGNYYTALGLMIEGGVDLARSLKMATEAPRMARVRRAAAVVHELVREGETLAGALAATELASPSDLSLLVAAERSGRLAETLRRLGRGRVEQFERTTRAALKLLEPAVVVVMGALVGLLVTALMLAVVSLNDLAP
ncbi:type II secretion system F family protein [Endothiovibrio diazotrophicus]